MSLARALEILGGFRAGFTRNGKLYLDGNTDATEAEIKAEAQKVWAESNTSQI
jgi:hypothetical protein